MILCLKNLATGSVNYSYGYNFESSYANVAVHLTTLCNS